MTPAKEPAKPEQAAPFESLTELLRFLETAIARAERGH